MRPTRYGFRRRRAVEPGQRCPSHRHRGPSGGAILAAAIGGAAFLAAENAIAASPLVLSDRQLDQVTAGMPVVTLNGSNIEVVMDIGDDIVWAVVGVGDGQDVVISNGQRTIAMSGSSATSENDGTRLHSSSYAAASTRNGTASASTAASADDGSASSSGQAQATGSGDNQAHSLSFTSAVTGDGAADAQTVSFSGSHGGTASTSSSGEVRSDDTLIYAPAVGPGSSLGAFALSGTSGYSFAGGQFSGSVGFINTSSSVNALGGSSFVVSGPVN